jgi:hypothetical protein
MRYAEAQTAASQHRARYGDDVILHMPEEWDGFLACEDCGWTCGYDGPGWGDDWDDEEGAR